MGMGMLVGGGIGVWGGMVGFQESMHPSCELVSGVVWGSVWVGEGYASQMELLGGIQSQGETSLMGFPGVWGETC